MTKFLVTYSVTFLVLAVLSFFLHQKFIDNIHEPLRFSLQPIYIFHFAMSLVICLVFKKLSTINSVSHQLGYIYLSTLFLKVILFVAIFKNSIINIENLTKTESLNLLIPLFVFLFFEVYFMAKILNQISAKTNH